MGFRDEIVKARRKVLPYIRFSQSLNSGAWSGPSERLYGAGDIATYSGPIKGQVLQFGSFSRTVANIMFSLEIPGTASTLMDPDRDWRLYAEEPYDSLLRKWLHYLLRVHDDSDDIYDATVALGLIQAVSYPAGRKVQLTTAVMAPEVLGDKIPRRIITLDDWPKAPPESVGRPVPIIYGRISNAVEVLDDEADTTEECDCPEYTPEPYASGIDNPNRPGIRWSDHFSHGSEGEQEILTEVVLPGPTQGDIIGSGVNGPAWLVRNYHAVSYADGTASLIIVDGAAPDGGHVIRSVDIYGEITRGVGPQTQALPYAILQDTVPADDGSYPRYGAAVGQFGACGMTRKGDAAMSLDGGHQPIFEVWARTTLSGASGTIITLQPWDTDGEDWRDLLLFVQGSVRRPNGAIYDGHSWQTPAMRRTLLDGEWSTIEMKWKISTYVDAYGTSYETPDTETTSRFATVAHDGWVQVHIDGQLVVYLQEIQFNLYAADGSLTTNPDFATYWEGVAFRPAGDASCVYVSQQLYCREAHETTVDEAEPCSSTVSSQNAGGAIGCPLVDAVEIVSLTRATGINAASQDNSQQVTGVIFYVGTPGNIPGGDQTFYRVTAVKAGVEYSWSELVIIDHTEPSYDRLEWDEWPGGADYYRIYQIVSLDLNLHEDMGGTLRNETYWVKQVPAIQAPGGRQDTFGPSPRWVEFGAWGEGTPQQAAAETTTTETSFLVCGHSVDEILDVYASLPRFREVLGGLNLMTGEKEPIEFQETEDRMTRLVEGTDYTVETVEKPSGRFTVIKVTRDMRDLDNCSFTPLTVNVSGIAYNADGSGGLITSGAHITRHFLLNWVFNHYETGEWFNDVASAPGLIDKDSFDTAKAYSENRIPGGYIGAVALIDPQDARSLILDAITSFNLNFFYKNAIDNNAGAWSVKMFDTRQFDPSAASVEEFDPNDDILADTFVTNLDLSLLVNVIHYMAGPNLVNGSQNGWMVTGTLNDYDSQARSWGRVEKDVIMPWTRDQATAVDIAAAQLDLRGYPFTFGSFQTMGRGVLTQPADIIKVTHPDAPGSGWVNRVVFLIGHDLDMDSGITTVRFYTTPSMVT